MWVKARSALRPGQEPEFIDSRQDRDGRAGGPKRFAPKKDPAPGRLSGKKKSLMILIYWVRANFLLRVEGILLPLVSLANELSTKVEAREEKQFTCHHIRSRVLIGSLASL